MKMSKTPMQVLQDHEWYEVVETHACLHQACNWLKSVAMPAGLIPKLLEIEPYLKIVVLTGFASVNTAVEAIKLGAIHYLSKPVGIDEIIEAFNKAQGNAETPIEATTISLQAAEHKYIKSILDKNNGNISATARELKMHRRTLQRKLDKVH